MPSPSRIFSKIPGPWLLGAALALALILRLAFIAYFYRHPANLLNVDAYTTFGAALVNWGEFSEVKGALSYETTPGFPLWIAFLYLIFGVSPLVVLIFNALLSTLTCLLAYLLGRRLFSPRAGVLALCFWVVYPYSIYYSGWTYRETFMAFLTAGFLWIQLEWLERGTWGLACLGGAVAAWIGLTNPVSLLAAGMAPLGFFFRERFATACRRGAPYFASLVLLYAPWPARNYRHFGAPLFTNAHGSTNLYQGLLVPSEAFGTEEEARIMNEHPEYRLWYHMMTEPKTVAEGSRLMKRASARLIRADPRRYARAVIGRVFKFWRPIPYERRYAFSGRKIFWASLFSDGLVIPLGLLGLFAFRGRWKELLPLHVLAGFWMLAYALVFVVIRFRFPVMMVPVLLAAGWLDKALTSRYPCRWRGGRAV